MIPTLTPSLRLGVLGCAVNSNKEFIFCSTFTSSLSLFQVTGINPEDGNAARRTCDRETNARETQRPEPPAKRWGALSEGSDLFVGAKCINAFSFLCVMSYDPPEMIPGAYCEEKRCLKVVTADCRLQVP